MGLLCLINQSRFEEPVHPCQLRPIHSNQGSTLKVSWNHYISAMLLAAYIAYVFNRLRYFLIIIEQLFKGK